jgi:hypothetical protein
VRSVVALVVAAVALWALHLVLLRALMPWLDPALLGPIVTVAVGLLAVTALWIVHSLAPQQRFMQKLERGAWLAAVLAVAAIAGAFLLGLVSG